MELGQRLKEAREEKGITIEQLAESTKIQKRYLTAIEDHQWDTIPGNFYVRAFVREYADAVGLSGDELITEYANELPSGDDRTYEYMTPSRKNSKAQKASNQIFTLLPKLLVFLLIIGIGFAIWYSIVNYIQPAITDGENEQPSQEIITAPEDDDDDDESDENAENGDEESSNEDEEESTEEEVEEVNPSLNVLDVNQDSTPRTTYELVDADSFVITLTVNDETYLEVDLTEDGEGSQPFSGMFRNDDDSPFEIDSDGNEVELEMNIGRASGFGIEVSGVELEYEVDPNDNVHQRIIILWENEHEED
ncbi:helix-turn-helix domain-containing protein [Alkalibacillus haloalkaliphilus]|uniref:Transcriptional regulator n=1 Tax=Alkalibacillus haloalkaliphilus TaxID=94136 RepID=A0A511W1L3_9BACI|nr:helix-turn-helix domain-containing protein [Alkalibacillus haloalkaliphilus]GEN44985.1 transcriptional regulator [Alkalibacillus haloalkaliphilus]